MHLIIRGVALSALLLSSTAALAAAQAGQGTPATPAPAATPVTAASPAAPAPAATTAATTAAAPKGPAVPGLVVWQGDAKLTLEDIDGRMSRIPPDKRAGFINDPERIEQMLRGLLLTKLLAHEAERAGLANDPVVQAEIELAKDEILARRRLSLHMRDMKLPDFDVLAHERYVSSPKLYRSPETLDIRHILLDTKKHGEAQAKAKAEQVLADIESGKIDFLDAVKQYSDDTTAKEDGGLIEGMGKGDTLADFDAAAFALKQPGDVSGLVKTKFGYHIIRLEKRVESVRYPFEQVKDQIVQELRDEAIARYSSDYLDQRRSTPLDANPELVQSLRTRYQPGAPGTLAIARTQGEIPAEAKEEAAAPGKPAAAPGKP
jgi:peptidyl-prolyl cis-trans isomerase C